MRELPLNKDEPLNDAIVDKDHGCILDVVKQITCDDEDFRNTLDTLAPIYVEAFNAFNDNQPDGPAAIDNACSETQQSINDAILQAALEALIRSGYKIIREDQLSN